MKGALIDFLQITVQLEKRAFTRGEYSDNLRVIKIWIGEEAAVDCEFDRKIMQLELALLFH